MVSNPASILVLPPWSSGRKVDRPYVQDAMAYSRVNEEGWRWVPNLQDNVGQAKLEEVKNPD